MDRSNLNTHTRYQKAAFEGDFDAATLMLREAQRRNDSVQIQGAESLLKIMNILGDAPNSGAWNRLCTLLENFASTSPEHLHRILSWITPAVDSWPSGLRIIPQSWCSEDFLSDASLPRLNPPFLGQTPQQKLRGLTRALNIMGPLATQPSVKNAPPKIEVIFTDQEIEVDLLQKYQHSLRRLLLHDPSEKTLISSSNIERLTLIGTDISAWENSRAFFPNLTSLCLIRLKNKTLDLEIIARCAPNLRHLNIRNSWIESLLNLNALENLEQFSLCGKLYLSEALIEHPKLRQITLQVNDQDSWQRYRNSPQPPFNVQIGPLPELKSMALHLAIKNTRWLKGCPKLRHLDLNCEAQKLENIKHCPDLQKLILKGKFRRLRFYLRKKSIPRSPLHPQLKYIDIRGCHHLISLAGVRHLPQLQTLRFEECGSLQNLNFLSETPQIQYQCLDLSKMRKLHSLEGLKSQAHIKKITLPGYIHHHLQEEIYYSRLKPLPAEILYYRKTGRRPKFFAEFFPILPTITQLRLSSDEIQSFRGFEKYSSLQILSLNGSRWIPDWSQLKEVGQNLLILDVRGCYRNHFADGSVTRMAKYYPPKSWFRRYEGQDEVRAALAQLKTPPQDSKQRS